ncbi:unnamed protein product [Calypogeia fissa]
MLYGLSQGRNLFGSSFYRDNCLPLRVLSLRGETILKREGRDGPASEIVIVVGPKQEWRASEKPLEQDSLFRKQRAKADNMVMHGLFQHPVIFEFFTSKVLRTKSSAMPA